MLSRQTHSRSQRLAVHLVNRSQRVPACKERQSSNPHTASELKGSYEVPHLDSGTKNTRSPNSLSFSFVFLHSLFLCVSHSRLWFFSVSILVRRVRWRFDCKTPEGDAHFADTAPDALYSTVISVSPAPHHCQARGGEGPGECVSAQTLEQIAKCTVEHFFHMCWMWFGSNRELLHFFTDLVWTRFSLLPPGLHTTVDTTESRWRLLTDKQAERVKPGTGRMSAS